MRKALICLYFLVGCAASAMAAGGSQAGTSTTLTVTPGQATEGALFTLIATVKDGAGTPATVGSVTFLDGSSVLGTSQVIRTASGGGGVGTAVWRTRSLPLGENKITAQYKGPAGNSTSPAANVAVTGKHPSSTVLTATGSNGVYVLTGTVRGAGQPNPTGRVAFTDNQTGTKIGSAALDPTSIEHTFMISSLGVGIDPVDVTIGDLNGDGVPDMSIL